MCIGAARVVNHRYSFQRRHRVWAEPLHGHSVYRAQQGGKEEYLALYMTDIENLYILCIDYSVSGR